jgi:hypothetical protein
MKTTGKLRKYIYGITFFFLVLTGFGQMPVYKRYYISDIPGLDWLSQFYLTHVMHYIASSVLIALAFYVIISYVFKGSGRITGSGYFKIFILAGLIVSGVLLVIRNLPGVFLDHNLIIVLDLTHLGLCMMLLGVSFYTLITKKSWVK